MATILLRIGRRRTSAEAENAHCFVEVEFSTKTSQLDLRPSVYEIAEEQLTQAHAEHIASNHLTPRSARDFDVKDLHSRMAATLGASCFALTRQAHRELTFESEAELHDFAARLLAEESTRSRAISKSDLREYVIAKIRKQDGEWMNIFEGLSEGSGGREWRKWFRRARSTQIP